MKLRNKWGVLVVPYTTTCTMCKNPFESPNPKAIYCPKCWERGKREYNQGQYEYKKEQKEDKE
jgi:Zn finger protein HypA/HybF involved in hydrogenase expression